MTLNHNTTLSVYTSKYEQQLWWTISHDANHAEDSSRDGSLVQIQHLGMLVTDTSLMLHPLF